MKGYTSEQQIENYLGINIPVALQTQVTSWIEQIEKYIDQVTGRNFKADTLATEKLFDGNGANIIAIDDAVQITEVKQGDGGISSASVYWTTLVKDEDYMQYPANELPKNELRTLGGVFYRGYQNIKVKAKWGYSATAPKDIMLAATILTAGIVNYANNSSGGIKSMSIGRYSVTYKDDKQWQDFDRIKLILDYYKKYDL
jgi:hypothetical protein